jgi:hypothetical protein
MEEIIRTCIATEPKAQKLMLSTNTLVFVPQARYSKVGEIYGLQGGKHS